MTVVTVSPPKSATWIALWKIYVTLLQPNDFLQNVCNPRKECM